jgi:hypothetical protein
MGRDKPCPYFQNIKKLGCMMDSFCLSEAAIMHLGYGQM